MPVYRVSVEVPNAARLTNNNEVRIGGHRVGVVESIEPVQPEARDHRRQRRDGRGRRRERHRRRRRPGQPEARQDGASRCPRTRSSASATARRSASSTSRSCAAPASRARGLHLRRHRRRRVCTLPASADRPPRAAGNGCFQEQTEFDDIANTFDTADARERARATSSGFGNAFAGRGFSLNQAIENLRPLFVEPEAGRRGADRAGHALRAVLPRARPTPRGSSPRSPRSRPSSSPSWRHLRRDLLRPRGAEGDDLRGRPDARDRDRDAAAPDPVPARLRDALARAAPRRRGPADHAADAERGDRRSARPCSSRSVGINRRPRGASSASSESWSSSRPRAPR